MKRVSVFLLAVLVFALCALPAYADNSPDVTVHIASPANIEMKPIYTGDITIKITNNSAADIPNMICYISIVDVGRGLSYNVDEFGPQAYQSRDVSLAAGETVTVVIPVKVVYVGDFRFSVTAIDLDSGTAYTSEPLTVNLICSSNWYKSF